MNNFDYKYMTPFKWFVLENFPFIENDFEAINNYRLFSKVVEYLNKMKDNVNLTGQQMENLTNAMIELQNYVNNYFDNLDIQDEINNKLDEMVQNGYFDILINNYFNPNFKIIMPKNFTNVEAGDIIILKVYDKNIVIDTHRNTAFSQVQSFLERNNISSIDYLILTHYHDDHVGNVVNLINTGYINENTIVYLPAYSSLIPQNQSTLSYYNEVNDALTNNNISHQIPSEGDILSINDFNLTFYNCETSIFENMNVTNYNDCSTVCLCEYGTKKALFTGDITDKPFQRFVNNQMFNYKIDIYKLSHHGNNINNEDITFLQQITPSLALHQTTSYSIEIGRNSRSSGLAYMMLNNIPIYSQYNNENDVIFDIYKDRYNLTQGKQNYSQSGYSIINEYYVDINTTNTIQNGTQNFPFKELAQALGKINKIQYCLNRIHVADGQYQFQTKQYVSGADVQITGNTSHPENVIINGELIFYDCNAYIEGLTIQNDLNYDGLEIQKSTALINKCIIKPTNETLSQKYGINSLLSRLTIRDTQINYFLSGIYGQNCLTYTYNNTFNNCTRAIQENRGLFARVNNTYNNVTNELMNSFSQEIVTPKTSEIIFNTSTATTENTEITLNKNFSNFKRLIVNFGNVSDGTWQSVIVSCYNNTNFLNNQAFTLQTRTGYIVLTLSSNNKATITTNSGNTQNIREIIGLYD